MNDECKIEISNEYKTKLEKISEVLNVSISKMIEIAFNEFFELVYCDTDIFLEKIGLLDNLREVINE
ncbi:MAG: hypothetical protein BAJALOKI2v1_40069 [Promethearchaeota archaeon]|nr:MAG: hypothetical protein BAJALOKI2v1_40069 [Candidatus Lokiarchaeota archaeon]